MFFLRQFPDPRRLRPLAENADYRRRFYARWGREHCFVLAASRGIELPPYTQRLSVKTVCHGAEHYQFDDRTLLIDEDSYLIVNDGRTYASRIAADRPVTTFSIFFAPGFAESVAGAILSRARDPLATDAAGERRVPAFSEHLRRHDRLVTPLLRRIRDRVQQGERDEVWYEEQLVLLLEALVKSQFRTESDIFRLPFRRPATRREVFRRIARATDYLLGNFRGDIGLEELAREARLSKYHFIKLFEAVHGHTPCAFLRRKRATAAMRLLESTRLPQTEVASLAGFTGRSTMYREIRRITGTSGRRIRAGALRTDGAAATKRLTPAAGRSSTSSSLPENGAGS
ncbi:MAG TPA: AraC family transcriptional regulator [Steroidobacteraceae bacterium]|nr:AraC family transcriptional regulator [Steroidobacteraceae bacterium]